MNKFNIGDEVVYSLKGKIEQIKEFNGKIYYQMEEQNKDVWLEEENILLLEHSESDTIVIRDGSIDPYDPDTIKNTMESFPNYNPVMVMPGEIHAIKN